MALPKGYGGAALWSACTKVVAPAARKFKPHLILVSAGFDAAEGDPLGGCAVPPRVFGALTLELLALAAELCEGRLLLALEGGYNPEVLADCVEAVAAALVAGPRDTSQSAAFAEVPEWLEGSQCNGPIRRTCEVHHTLALRLPLPLSKSDRKRAGSEDAVPAARARLELHENELVLRIAPLRRPRAASVSADEVWVWHGDGAVPAYPAPAVSATGLESTTCKLLRWRLRGVQADVAGPLKCAEFRERRQEFTIRLRMGPILGGVVSVTPVEREAANV